MNRGWIVGGALVLVAAPAVPAAAAGVTMVLDRVDESAGLRKWVGVGDVLRYQVRFEGAARDAWLAVATTPVDALTGLTCTSPSQRERPTDPRASTTAEPLASQGVDAEGDGRPASSSELGEDTSPQGIMGGSSDGASAAGALAARTLADMETSGASTAVVRGGQACALGDLSGRRAVDVVLTVPEGTGEVALAAVARLRQGGGLTTMTEATGVPVRTTGPDGAAASSGDAVDPKTRTSRSRSVRQHDVKAVRTTRRQHQELGVAEAPRQPEARETDETIRQPEAREVDEAPPQPEVPDLTEATRRPGAPRRAEVVQQPANPAKHEVSAKQVEPGDAGIVRQPGKPGEDEAGKLKKVEGVRPGGQVGASEGLRRVAEDVRRGGEGTGLAGDLRREPVLGEAAEGTAEGTREAELPPAVVPTVSAAPSVTGVSMDVPGAPLPRAVAAPQVRLQAAEVVNPLAGGRGLSAAAGGIAVLMAGLWAISRAHRARTRRKVL